MLVDAVIRVVVGLFTGILSLVPDAPELHGSVTSLAATIGSGVATANQVFPVTTLGACIGAVIAVRLFMLAWTGIVWVYTKIPFKAS